jgi:hypothetical protein
MVGRNVECFEIVVIGFNLGAVYNVESHTSENINHIIEHDGKRMKSTFGGLPSGHCDIKSFCGKALLGFLFLKRTKSCRKGFFDFCSDLVCELTHYPWHCAEGTLKSVKLKRMIFSHIGNQWESGTVFDLPYPNQIAEDGDEFEI